MANKLLTPLVLINNILPGRAVRSATEQVYEAVAYEIASPDKRDAHP